MDFHIPDYVQVSIEGNDATPYIISYHRRDDLCEMGESFDLSLSDQYPWILSPYNDITIKELYGGSTGYVLRGYIIEISQDFIESEIKIKGLDKSTLLNDYYIAQELKSNGQTVDYWINRIIQMTGLSVHFDVHSTQIVEVDTPLGYQTATDAVLKLERLAAYYVKYDPQNDYIKIFRLSSSQPVITISTLGSNKPLEVDRKLGTENTRNVVKIYGGYKYDPITKTATQVFDSAKTEMPELLVDKTSVVMSSAVRSQTYAHIVANRILAVVNSLDDEQLYMLAGFYPTVNVGNGCYIDVDHANYDYKGNRMITSIETSVDSKGATTTIGVGKKCPRIAIQLADPPIFVTTTKDGVGVSWDGGDNFVLSNTGLVGSDAKFAWSIAVNQYGQSMVLTNDGVYRRWGTGGVWHKIPGTLPDPPNNANDLVPTTISGVTLAKVVEEPTRYNKFHILARKVPSTTSGWNNRTWVYSTRNFGSTWDCDQLYVTQARNITCISGLSWSVYGADIESSPVNNVYVLVEGGTPKPEVPSFVGTISGYYLGYQEIGDVARSSGTALVYDNKNETVITNRVYTSLYDRNVSWHFQLSDDKNNPMSVVRIWSTIDNGRHWNMICNQKVYNPITLFKCYDDDPNHAYINFSYWHKYMYTRMATFFDYLGSLNTGQGHWRIPFFSTDYINTFNRTDANYVWGHWIEYNKYPWNTKQSFYIGYIDIIASPYAASVTKIGPTEFDTKEWTQYYGTGIHPDWTGYSIYDPFHYIGYSMFSTPNKADWTYYAYDSRFAYNCDAYAFFHVDNHPTGSPPDMPPLLSLKNDYQSLYQIVSNYDSVNDYLKSVWLNCSWSDWQGSPDKAYKSSYLYGNHSYRLYYAAIGNSFTQYPGMESIVFGLTNFDIGAVT